MGEPRLSAINKSCRPVFLRRLPVGCCMHAPQPLPPTERRPLQRCILREETSGEPHSGRERSLFLATRRSNLAIRRTGPLALEHPPRAYARQRMINYLSTKRFQWNSLKIMALSPVLDRNLVDRRFLINQRSGRRTSPTMECNAFVWVPQPH